MRGCEWTDPHGVAQLADRVAPSEQPSAEHARTAFLQARKRSLVVSQRLLHQSIPDFQRLTSVTETDDDEATRHDDPSTSHFERVKADVNQAQDERLARLTGVAPEKVLLAWATWRVAEGARLGTVEAPAVTDFQECW
jgi:hypothetical protein